MEVTADRQAIVGEIDRVQIALPGQQPRQAYTAGPDRRRATGREFLIHKAESLVRQCRAEAVQPLAGANIDGEVVADIADLLVTTGQKMLGAFAPRLAL